MCVFKNDISFLVEKCEHVPHCVSQSALLAEPPRHQARRNRTHFAEEAVTTMQRVFEVNPYPDILLREQLARQIGIPESRIQVRQFLRQFVYYSHYMMI